MSPRPSRLLNRPGSPVYKLLLCVRYLQTRYLAFICIISVMLGVATLLVVNAVMSGFSTKLKDRLHGVLSDVVIDTDRMDGFPQSPVEMIKTIKKADVGGRIEAISPTVEVFAILQHNFHGQVITKPVRLIGIDPVGRAAVGGFSEYLVRQKDDPNPSFELTPKALKHHDTIVRQFALANAPFELGPPNLQLPLPDPNAPPPPDLNIMTKDMPAPKLHGWRTFGSAIKKARSSRKLASMKATMSPSPPSVGPNSSRFLEGSWSRIISRPR
jgi:lipoprotein-releasing system permease protein